jgi:uncharacterized protein (DUF433 family)
VSDTIMRPCPHCGALMVPKKIGRPPGRPRGRPGFTDQDIVEYYNTPHTIRECSEQFALTFQRVQQILSKYKATRARGFRMAR